MNEIWDENEGNYSPLGFAIEKGRDEIVSILLEHGANPNLRFCQSGQYYTALEYAQLRNQQACVKLLSNSLSSKSAPILNAPPPVPPRSERSHHHDNNKNESENEDDNKLGFKLFSKKKIGRSKSTSEKLSDFLGSKVEFFGFTKEEDPNSIEISDPVMVQDSNEGHNLMPLTRKHRSPSYGELPKAPASYSGGNQRQQRHGPPPPPFHRNESDSSAPTHYHSASSHYNAGMAPNPPASVSGGDLMKYRPQPQRPQQQQHVNAITPPVSVGGGQMTVFPQAPPENQGTIFFCCWFSLFLILFVFEECVRAMLMQDLARRADRDSKVVFLALQDYETEKLLKNAEKTMKVLVQSSKALSKGLLFAMSLFFGFLCSFSFLFFFFLFSLIA